jgi:hypothetical protein
MTNRRVTGRLRVSRSGRPIDLVSLLLLLALSPVGKASADLLFSLDARQPGSSPGTQWEDLSGNNAPFVSNGNPTHNAGGGVYFFDRDGLFTGSVADESLYDFDTNQGSGATPFTLVFYASITGNEGREGMINKQATSQAFGWNAGLSQDEFGLNNVHGELRTDDNNNRTIVRAPGAAGDPHPDSLNDIGVTANVLNLYVMHFSGHGQDADALDTYINGSTTPAFERMYQFATLTAASILNDQPLRIGGNTDHVTIPNGNHWLKVKLVGDGLTVNASAIGAQARIDLGGGTILSRQVEGGTGEGNQNDLTLHFGLASRTSPVDINLTWPNGLQESVLGVAVNQMICVTNGMGEPPPMTSDLLLSLDAREPGISPATQWQDLSLNNAPFVSNGSPVYNAGAGTYTFNYNGLFTGNVADESLFDLDSNQGTGPTPFTVVFYASVNGNESRPGMINKLATSQDTGWSAGLSQDEFGVKNAWGELRTHDNNNRTIVKVPGDAADPFPNSLDHIGVTAAVLNLYVMHFSGKGQGLDAVDTYILLRSSSYAGLVNR